MIWSMFFGGMCLIGVIILMLYLIISDNINDAEEMLMNKYMEENKIKE